MVSSERLLLIVAADWREFAGFRDRRPVQAGVRWAYRAEIAAGPALLAANGPGCDNVGRAVAEAARRFDLSGVVSTGFAGGLDPALEVADLFVAERVFRLDSPVGYPGGLTQVDGVGVHRGKLVTIDAVAQTAAEKSALRASGADVVDMEAGEVARQAHSLGVPFYCVRAISDTADIDFSVDFNRARRLDGTFSGWKVALQAGWRFRRWRDLLTLKRNSELAAARLAVYLTDCRFLPPSK